MGTLGKVIECWVVLWFDPIEPAVKASMQAFEQVETILVASLKQEVVMPLVETILMVSLEQEVVVLQVGI